MVAHVPGPEFIHTTIRAPSPSESFMLRYLIGGGSFLRAALCSSQLTTRITMPRSGNATMNERYVAKYVVLDHRTPSPEEIAIRHTAQDLKIPTSDAIQQAAPGMAALIDGPCWLVPVPASNGRTTANMALANAIAALVTDPRVKCAVGRTRPVESSYQRRVRGLTGLTVEQHAIIRTAGPLEPLPVYFIDNVVTTGTTIAACRRALGWGAGLTYADASSRNLWCAEGTQFPWLEPLRKNCTLLVHAAAQAQKASGFIVGRRDDNLPVMEDDTP